MLHTDQAMTNQILRDAHSNTCFYSIGLLTSFPIKIFVRDKQKIRYLHFL